jgi:ribonuclease P protein component
MREAYRLQKNPLQDELEENQLHLAVFIIYTGNQLPEFDIVFEKMAEILFRLLKIISK